MYKRLSIFSWCAMSVAMASTTMTTIIEESQPDLEQEITSEQLLRTIDRLFRTPKDNLIADKNMSDYNSRQLGLTHQIVGEQNIPDDMHESFEQICSKYGYHVEEHQVKTEDGYLLRLFRITGRQAQPQMPSFGPFIDDERTFGGFNDWTT